MLQFLDSARFMASTLSNLANNLSDGTNFKDDLIEYKCLCCNKNYQHMYDEIF